MSLTNRFTAIDKAILVATGNSLIVCGDANAITVNTSDMITSSGGYTRDWTQAGSTASINILENSTILYAELTWYSTVKSNVSGALDVRSIQDTAITFTTPKNTYQITPIYMETFNAPSGTIDRFRSAVVTDIIKTDLSGNYTVSKVPTSIPSTGLSNTRAGWSLAVFFRNDLLEPRMLVYSSGIANANSTTPLQVTYTGYTTPTEDSKFHGNMFFACANGQPLDGTEYVKVGPSFASLTAEGNPVTTPNPNPGTAPNNPVNSFFAGQINVCNILDTNNGLININGTNGSNNHDPFVPTQVVGGRNKWDITNIDISNTIVPDQNQLAVQVTESGNTDGVMIVGMAAGVIAKAPNITTTFAGYDPDGRQANRSRVGEQLVYVMQIKNSGSLPATNVTISSILDSHLTLIPNSLKVNGNIIQGADISTGVNLGTLDPTAVMNISFTTRIDSLPPSKSISTSVDYHYSFISGSGSPTVTNYATTTTATTAISESKLTVTKTASSLTAQVGDTIDYTIVVNNVGTSTATNVLFQDIISEYSSFVTGSVAINGIIDPTLNPSVGFSLQNLASGEQTTITFSVDITSLPPSTKVYNSTEVTYTVGNYTYTVFSNIISIQIQYTDIVGERCSDDDYPAVGDTVTNTLSLTNIGNITATNVQVAEPPIFGQSFIPGTVVIDGVPKPLLNPFTGFTINSIGPKQTVNIDYDMVVNQVNPNRLVQNIARVPFKYQIDQSEPVISSEKDSNKVTTLTSYVNLSLVKTVDKAYATIDDILYYSIAIKNTGNIDAINTIFLDPIQVQGSFISNTVAINGVLQPGFNPNIGFSVGTICPGNDIVVTFQVKVNSVPNPNIIYNTSQLTYGFLPDPNGTPVVNTVMSNTVQTIINKISFTINKVVDKAYAQVGDTLAYTVYIQNTGTVILKNVKFVDGLTPFVTLYPGQVYINGIQYPNLNPSTGFSLGDIHPGDTVRVSMGVWINTVPPTGFVINFADMVYTYQINPNSQIITQTATSNEVTTEVVNGNLAITKTVDKSYATLNDILEYDFNISNTGNVTATNISFIDPIPTGATFVAGTVSINGINKPTYDPTVGFQLSNLAVGQVVNIHFQAKVTSVPIPNTIINQGSTTFHYVVDPTSQPISKTVLSNTVTTVVNVSTTTLTKSVDKAYATINDILNYTVIASNTGTVNVYNVNFLDIIPTGATFVSGSVTIDGVTQPTFDPNIGFALPTITPEGTVAIQFQAKVTSVPTPNTIINSGSMTYNYKLSPTGQEYSGSKTSNTVTTVVNRSTVTNTKSVDKVYATINDELTYTSVITNTGNVPITNVIFEDLLPLGLTFKANSVTINGTAEPGYDPNLTFPIGTIAPGAIVTVVFKATVTSLPSYGYVTNTSTVTYQYKVDPNGQTYNGTTTSNSVTTHINVGSLTITKSADRDYARINDVIKYTILITNTGNVTLKNLNFTDTIQTESSFNANSVYIDGVNYPTYNPNVGFPLTDIGEGEYRLITFAVTVNTIPASNHIYNTGSVTYTYYIDPNGTPIVKTATSNQTSVYISTAIVSGTKSVDKSIATIGNDLTYSFVINNTGNTPALTVLFEDVLDSHLQFVSGSVIINGTSAPLADPNLGFSIPDIAANGTDTVSFRATIISRPPNNIIYNYATISYEYKPTPTSPYTSVTFNTNTVQTFVAYGELSVTKAVDKVYATIGDSLNYSVLIKNTGSVDATNINFLDLIQAGATFVSGSVVIDGTPAPTFDPDNGFVIHNLVPNQSVLVSFIATVTSLPVSGKVDNFAAITFSYKLTPTGSTITTTTNSNTVTTYINIGRLNVTKTVDKFYATIGDILNYSFTINNYGSVPCSSVTFKDIIQAEATFNTGSVIVNGVSKPTFNPNTGFALDDIAPSATTTVTFSVTVNAIPANSYIYNYATVNYSYYVNPNNPYINTSTTSNTVQSQINVGKLVVTKAVNLSYATINDIIIYTVTVANTGNVPATFVNFRDIIPTGLTFIQNSVTIDGIAQPGYDPFQSFTLGTIAPGDTVIVKFKATVTSVPTPSLVTNTATVTFTYRINPAGPDIINEVTSNPVTTQINLGQLSITKAVDKTYATINDVLTYSFVINNTGNVDTDNVFFQDILQSDITFNTGSVIVNGQSKPSFDPTIGFSLGTIATLQTVTLSFEVTIVPHPTQNVVLNYGVLDYDFKIDPNGSYYSKNTNSNTVMTYIRIGKLSSTKTVNLSYATLQSELLYTIVVTNTGNTTSYNLFFADILSSGATFIDGSVVIDNNPEPSFNPITGFYIPNLESGNTSTVQFKARVISVPNPPQVTNYATTNGFYKINPQGPDYSVSTTTNTVSTQINVGNLNITKAVDKLYANVTDTLTYSNIITNVGNVNATAVIFQDTLQQEISFISGTVRINGVVYPLLDPTIGFSLADLAPTQSVSVEFDVRINSLPVPPQVNNTSNAQFSYKIDPSGAIITKTNTSNLVTTQIVLGQLTATKSVDKSIATIGDILNYSVTITNTGNVLATNTLFQDTPSTGATFKPGSVIINGVSEPTFDPTVGFTLGDIGIGNVVTVQFQATVTSIPPTNKVTNQATISFKYVVDPKQPPVSKTTTSNTTTTNIAVGNLSVTKAVDKAYATIGDYLTYTVVITNIGNINATNVVFLDQTPANSQFTLGSVTVNGVSYPSYNPSAGFDLGTMTPGQIITVVYKVQVIS